MAGRAEAAALDRQFFALADAKRRRVLTRLEHGPANLGDLAQEIGVALPTMLKHVRLLETARLVRTAKEGRARVCRIDTHGAREAASWLQEHRRFWSGSLDRLARVLESRGRA